MNAAVNAADGRLGLLLSELRLPTIKRIAGDLCAQSDREGWPGRRLLEAVLEDEVAERETRRIDRHRAESQLSPDKRFSSFEFSAVPSGHALIEAGHRVLFARCSDIVQRMQAARRDMRLPQELTKLDRYDLLILDDISYVRRDQLETSVLFELIAERYEHKSLAITANTPFWHRGKISVEPAMKLAAVDRLVHHSTILEMNVESYRRRSAQAEGAPAARKP